MPFCSKCGAETSEGDQFCKACGFELLVKAAPLTACRHCGAEIDATLKYCPECGWSLKEEIERVEDMTEEIQKKQKTRQGVIGCLVIVAALVVGAVLFVAVCSGTSTLTEAEYAEAVASQCFMWSAHSGELAGLLENPQLFDSSWNAAVDHHLSQYLSLNEEAQALSPPESMKEVDVLYKDACQHFANSAVLIRQGIDQLDVSLIDQATSEMLLGSALLEQATELAESMLP